ncbi:BET1-like protein [Poecilia latipinna]|uniref:BET1-like protein n=3 Tax=Poecilia TaxID=8080 RepID=A0A087Y8I9_POEFO|nr:PREDICTED: BET1-like protein [Poecilia formosa]XP_014827479.1 PREDICTED: BET1-like protein [Poecilia mexicana]XP_014897783.1 PREDICTED: BET1-like protein [Poecilia latipinna]
MFFFLPLTKWRTYVIEETRWSCASEQLIVPSESNMADWNRGHGSVDSMLDAENKRLADNLASKVSRLKSLAYDIDRDVEDQNDYLDNMDSNFMSATGLLSGSVKRFSTMVRSGKDNRRLLCYVSGGLVLAFFLLYYLVSRIQS